MAAASESKVSISVPHPITDNINEENGILRFTVRNINVSLANAIRRTILANIETPVFRTTPYEKSQTNIHINTSRLTNEIIKQRISCIPIHIKDPTLDISTLLVELHVKNEGDTMLNITTKDFKIKDTTTDKYLSESEVHKIFPPNSFTKEYILLNRLCPKISDSIPGQELKLESKMTRSTASEDSCFNVACSCSYAFTEDKVKQKEEWRKKALELKKKGMSDEEIEYEEENWYFNDAKRIYLKNSFDFVIESIGVYTNMELFNKACKILINKSNALLESVSSQTISIEPSQTTMKHSFDITLVNEDYTLGKCIEFALYSIFYEQERTLSVVGFQKRHPYDKDSIIRLAFKKKHSKNDVFGLLLVAAEFVKQQFTALLA